MSGGQLIGLLAAGAGVWWLGSSMGWFGAPTTAAPSTGETAPAAGTPTPSGQSAATQQLTAQDANEFLYSSSVTADQMTAISAALNQEIQGGQVQQILGTSVAAYMLGWGGASAGATKTALGQTYTFDGTNWNLQPTAQSSSSSSSSSSSGGSGPFYAAGQISQLISQLQAVENMLRTIPASQALMAAPLQAQKASLISQIQALGGTVPQGMGAFMPTHAPMVHTNRMNYRRKARFA